MRKLNVLLLALIIAFAFIGCKKSNTTTNPPVEEAVVIDETTDMTDVVDTVVDASEAVAK